jgi:hypothetical protein
VRRGTLLPNDCCDARKVRKQQRSKTPTRVQVNNQHWWTMAAPALLYTYPCPHRHLRSRAQPCATKPNDENGASRGRPCQSQEALIQHGSNDSDTTPPPPKPTTRVAPPPPPLPSPSLPSPPPLLVVLRSIARSIERREATYRADREPFGNEKGATAAPATLGVPDFDVLNLCGGSDNSDRTGLSNPLSTKTGDGCSSSAHQVELGAFVLLGATTARPTDSHSVRRMR